MQNETAPAQITWKYVPHGQSSELIIYNGREVAPQFDRFRIQECSWNCNLELKEARITDAGSYKCLIILPGRNVETKISTVIVFGE